uniref:uncharacterized protein LOC114671492 n=1 Tax=Macaca mulatta TaxID=9544 RepID=UPI0010A2A324|nr:uncharacterized protein LOC114671492 [Macaca mulatta]
MSVVFQPGSNGGQSEPWANFARVPRCPCPFVGGNHSKGGRRHVARAHYRPRSAAYSGSQPRASEASARGWARETPRPPNPTPPALRPLPGVGTASLAPTRRLTELRDPPSPGSQRPCRGTAPSKARRARVGQHGDRRDRSRSGRRRSRPDYSPALRLRKASRFPGDSPAPCPRPLSGSTNPRARTHPAPPTGVPALCDFSGSGPGRQPGLGPSLPLTQSAPGLSAPGRESAKFPQHSREDGTGSAVGHLRKLRPKC